MTILYADGFELGTTLAEANTLSGLPIASSNNFTTQTTTFGPNSGGTGASIGARSLTYSLTPNNNGTSVFSYLAIPIPLLAAVSGTMTSFTWGFRAKANASWGTSPSSNGVSIGIGNLQYIASGSQGFSVYRSTSTTGSYPLTANNTAVGPQNTAAGLPVLDNAWHYHTYYFVRTSSTWTITRWLDNVLIGVYTGVTITWPATPYLMYHNSQGGTGSLNIFQELDDMYMSYNEAPIGDVSIQRIVPGSDVQAQWTRYGAASNYAAIDKIDLTNTSGIQATTTVSDLYGTSLTTPTAKRIAAVKTTVYGLGTSADVITATAKSGATVVASTATAMNPFSTVVTTGWDATLANTSVASLQFGVNRA